MNQMFLSARIRMARRAAERGVTLVEVLIVVTIMALIAGGAVLVAFPQLREARVKTAITSAGAVRQAAQLYVEVDMAGATDRCPTVEDLVVAKKLERGKTEDPWGRPFKINCVDGEIRAVSVGADGKEGTPDDVRDDTSLKDVPRIANGVGAPATGAGR
jgi:general secretion pathway protein G